MFGLGLVEFWSDSWNRFDVVVISFAYISMIVENLFATFRGLNMASLRAMKLLRLLRLLRMARGLRVFAGSTTKTKVLLRTFSQFGRIVVPMGLVLLMIVHTYAIIGVEILGEALVSSRSSVFDGCSPHCPSFDTFTHAVLTLLQLAIGSSWSSMMK